MSNDCQEILQVSMELLMIEVGILDQPLLLPFNKYHFFAINSWVKLLWEKLWKFGLQVTLGNVKCRPPQVGNVWLMTKFEEL